MNGHSEEYEIAMDSVEAFEMRAEAEQPEFYALIVNGADVIVDTADACEQYALTNYSLTNDQFDQLCSEGWVTSSDDSHIEIVPVDASDRARMVVKQEVHNG